MGWGEDFRCKKCGRIQTVFLGYGCRYPEMYQIADSMIRTGKCGKEWKELYESIPGAATNAAKPLHVCTNPDCRAFHTKLDLSIYRPIDPNTSKIHKEPYSPECPATDVEYVAPYELKKAYVLVKTYSHKCPDCGSPMRHYKEGDKLKCTGCHEPAMDYIPSMHMWK